MSQPAVMKLPSTDSLNRWQRLAIQAVVPLMLGAMAGCGAEPDGDMQARERAQQLAPEQAQALSGARWPQVGVPWVDRVSDNFMMQVPSQRVDAGDELPPLLRAWDKAIQDLTKFLDTAWAKRNDVMMCGQPDLQMRHSQSGSGYPLLNSLLRPAPDPHGVSLDRAAVDWMVTPNFGNGAERDHTNTQAAEFRNPQRGDPKYTDIARLFGWDTLKNFYYQENLDLIAGAPGDGLSATDSRILRLSVAAGADLTPLIHFWGLHPKSAAALQNKITAKGLRPNNKVRDLLLRYRSLIPADRQQFAQHFNAVHPGMPTSPETGFGAGWYHVRMAQWDAHSARLAQSHINDILARYFP